MASIFGFQFKRKKDEVVSFAPPVFDDGAVAVAAGGAYGTYVDLEGSARTEAELVTKYREMALHPEIDAAVSDIVNEAISDEEDKGAVHLNLENVPVVPKIKDLITAEFNYLLELFEFNTRSYDVFRRWYVDGRLVYHVIIDEKAPQNGIKELRYVDPRKIRKVREMKRKPIADSGVSVTQVESEYYIYNDKGFQTNISATSNAFGSNGLKISSDAILGVNSGVLDKNNQLVLGHLHKAIKALNQLRTLEDATLIYKISRAPERRIFYIDVGNLPKMKAEQYLRDIMTRFKNRVVYDSSTGEVRDDRKFMTMLEDFWLPRREGGRGTEISTLPAGQLAGDLEDVKYFQRNLYKSLNVPVNRLEPDNTYTMGRATEITRDEVKFTKFVSRLQTKFSELFLDALEKQLVLKRIIAPEEWPALANKFKFDYSKDNQFTELKALEIIRERNTIMSEADPYVGKYYSNEWVKRNILRQDESEMQTIMTQINNEIKAGIIQLAPPPGEEPPKK